ncbi:MAG: M28 family peptidase [Rufibacter sp.]
MAALCLLFFCACQSEEEEVQQEKDPEVPLLDLSSFEGTYKNLVGALAHDSLHGRWLAEDGISRTERLIKKEFTRIGLAQHPSFQNFQDNFNIVTTEIQTLQLHLNNQSLPASDVLIIPQAPRGQLQLNAETRIVNFNTSSPLNTQASTFSNSAQQGKTYVVLVPSALKTSFQEFKNYVKEMGAFMPNTLHSAFGYPIRYGYNNIIYVLTDNQQVTSLSVDFAFQEKTINNIVGMLPGKSKPKEYVIFSAHMDHLGMGETGTDKIFNGANDNASGTAAVITLANYFATQNLNERSILFVLFNAEEKGLLGSKHFVNVFPEKAAIKAVINIDMIGNISPYGAGKAYVTGHSQSNLLTVMNKSLKVANMTLNPEPESYNLFSRSDNFPFVSFKIPSHTITTFNNDDALYHTAADETNTVDLISAFQIVKTIAQGSVTTLQGTDTPVAK